MRYLYYKKKNKAKYIIIITAVILVLLILFFIFSGNKSRPTSSEAEKTTTPDIPVISKGIFKITHNYSCGHSELEETDIPRSYIGKTTEELRKKNENYNFLNYSDNILTAEINEAVKCANHYRIQLVEDSLMVYCEKFPDSPERKIKLNLIGLYEDEIEILKSGIEFGSKNAMLEFLEDFES